MADVHYYVSQQTGDNSRDGLSPSNAWATLTKANTTVAANANGDAYIHIGPGTYRESILIATAGTDATHRIIWAGDPDCVFLTTDKPGVVRVTVSDANDLPAAATNYVFSFNSKNYVELWDMYVDGCVYNQYVVIGTTNYGANGQVCRRMKSHNYYGFSKVICFECFSSGSNAYYLCTAFNCVGIGSGIGSQGVFNTTYSYNCLAIGGYYGFYNCTYIYNCVSVGATSYGYYGGTISNCYAAFAGTGFNNTGTPTNCKSYQCGAVATTGNMPLFDFDITPIFRKAFADLGTNTLNAGANLPTNDLIGATRLGGSGTVDMGPWEVAEYETDFVNYLTYAPSIKLKRAGMINFKFPVEAGRPVIKSAVVKHINTAVGSKPQIMVTGLGITPQVQTASYDADTWETLSIHFTPTASGVMDFWLVTRDTTDGSYSLFCDLV